MINTINETLAELLCDQKHATRASSLLRAFAKIAVDELATETDSFAATRSIFDGLSYFSSSPLEDKRGNVSFIPQFAGAADAARIWSIPLTEPDPRKVRAEFDHLCDRFAYVLGEKPLPEGISTDHHFRRELREFCLGLSHSP